MSTAITLIAIIVIIAILFLLFDNKKSSEYLKNDAKRFAELLVYKIKLDETYKLERGLKNNSLYESLRDEIEEARKTYKKRIPNSDSEILFDEALVTILANGDKSKLG